MAAKPFQLLLSSSGTRGLSDLEEVQPDMLMTDSL